MLAIEKILDIYEKEQSMEVLILILLFKRFIRSGWKSTKLLKQICKIFCNFHMLLQ